jgi:hypothetical protein
MKKLFRCHIPTLPSYSTENSEEPENFALVLLQQPHNNLFFMSNMSEPLENQNWPKPASFLEKVICRLRSPLATLPETKHLTSTRESIKYGFDALACRLIAESLIVGVQYTVHSAVEGDIAEFGTQTGRTAKVISTAMRLYRADKSLHLFDSFEGMPEAHHPADLDNEHVKQGVWGKGQLRGASPEQLRAWCGRRLPADSIKIYKGWFSDTLPKIPTGQRFSMIHIDSDLYSSAHEVLEFMFKTHSLTEGALVYFDDWNCNRASNNHGERKAWLEITKRYNVSFDDLGGYSWAGHKFVIHDYSIAKC